MPATDPRRQLAAVALFLAPVALVKLTAMWLGAGPTGAVAQTERIEQSAPRLPMFTSPTHPTPDHERLSVYLQQLREQSWGPSPFYHEPRTAQRRDPALQPMVADQSGIGSVPELIADVRAIMATRSGAVALVNGVMRQEGDLFTGGWSILRIDSDAGVVVFQHEHGEKQTRSVRQGG